MNETNPSPRLSSAFIAADRKLLQIVSAPRPAAIEHVIERMQAIDAALAGDDGLKWFNWLYLLVTTTVRNQKPPGGWKHEQWLMRLDVVFANLYLDAIAADVAGKGAAPKSWRVLFEARHLPLIERIQFALSGMNAHINRDLSLAVLQTNSEFGVDPGKNSREYADFQYVNNLLGALIPEALNTLATGIVGELVQGTGKIGRLLALWNVRVARDLAWDFSDHLNNLHGPTRQFALSTQDQLTGAIGRSLLLLV